MTKDEIFTDPSTGHKIVGPSGTRADMDFLQACGIDPWSSFGMITFVLGEHPWTYDGTVIQCDRDRHSWKEWGRNVRTGQGARFCSKCDAMEEGPLF